MRAYDAAKYPWLTIPFIGGFLLAFLPVMFVTKEGANQHKDDIVKTTYRRSDGTTYTETRGSFAPAAILVVGIGVLAAVAVAIYNFMKNAEDSILMAIVFSMTQFALLFALIKRKELLEIAERKSKKEGTGWLIWVALLATLAWPWTDLLPLFEIRPNNIPYLYIPLTIFLFLGFVVPILASLQVFYLLLWNKSYGIISFAALFLYFITWWHGSDFDGEKIGGSVMPIAVYCVFPALIIMANLKIWQNFFSKERGIFAKVFLCVLGSLTGFVMLVTALSVSLYILFYENNGYNYLSYFFTGLATRVDTSLLLYPPLVCLLLVSIYSFYSTKKHKHISTKNKTVITCFNALAVVPIVVFGLATTIEANRYYGFIKESKMNNEVRYFVSAYKRPEDVSRKSFVYFLLLVKENVFASSSISMIVDDKKEAMKIDSHSSDDKFVISVRAARKQSEDIDFFPSLPVGKADFTLDREGEKTSFYIDTSKRALKRAYYKKTVRL